MIGRVLARRKQAGVAFDRMRMLVADEARRQHRAVASTCRSSAGSAASVRTRSGPARVPLERLDVVALSARYPDGTGVGPLSFAVRRGSSRWSPGPVGSGKSTLLRAMLGLAWQSAVSGEVRWNGAGRRRSRSVPRTAERGVPAAGAAAGVGLRARQRLARPDGHGPDRHRAAARRDLGRHQGDAQGRGHADRAAWSAPVGRPAPAAGDGAGPSCTAQS